VSEGAKRDYEQSVDYMNRCKSVENENKQLRNIQESLSGTLSKVKTEHELIIQSLRGNLELKDKELTRF